MTDTLQHHTEQIEEPPLAAPRGSRLLITDIATLEREFADGWLGQDFAIDLETTGLDPAQDEILGIALTFADNRHYYIVLSHTDPLGEHFVGDSHDSLSLYPRKRYLPSKPVYRLLTLLAAQSDVTVVAHNLKFELHFLRRVGIEFYGTLADTMLAAQLVDENRRVGLKSFGASVGVPMRAYQDLEHYPGFGKHEILGVPLSLVADYAMDDTEATWRLWQKLQQEMVAEGVEKPFTEIWMPLTCALQEMEARGIAMNMDGVRDAKRLYEDIRDAAELRVWGEGIHFPLLRYASALQHGVWDTIPERYLETIPSLRRKGIVVEEVGLTTAVVRGEELPVWRKFNKDGAPSKVWLPRVPWFNPGSPAQLKELLFDWLGVPVEEVADAFDLKFSGDENAPVYAADRDNLRIIKHEMGDECPAVIDDLLVYRKAAKLLSTYLNTYEERCDSRDHHALRTSFNQASTDTGRLSSSKPNLDVGPSSSN